MLQDDSLLNQVVKNCREEFTKEEIPAIYIDKVPQNFTRPCLVVIEYDIHRDRLFNEDRFFIYNYDILVYNKKVNDGEIDDIYTFHRKIGWRLSICLDSIQVGATKIMCARDSMDSFVQDGVGHFMVDFCFKTRLRDNNVIPKILDDSYKNNIKKGD